MIRLFRLGIPFFPGEYKSKAVLAAGEFVIISCSNWSVLFSGLIWSGFEVILKNLWHIKLEESTKLSRFSKKDHQCASVCIGVVPNWYYQCNMIGNKNVILLGNEIGNRKEQYTDRKSYFLFIQLLNALLFLTTPR